MFGLRARYERWSEIALSGWKAWSLRDQPLVVCLVVFAAVMIATKWAVSMPAPWGLVLFLLAGGAATFWRAAPLAATLGIASASVAWTVLGLPGALGILFVAPLTTAFVGQGASRTTALAIGLLVLATAEAGSVMAVLNGRGSAIELVSNVVFAAAAVAVAAQWRSAGADAPATWVTSLTKREAEVYALLRRGKTNAAIAEKLRIRLSTVKTHVRAILRKAEAKSRHEAVRKESRRIEPLEDTTSGSLQFE